MAPSPTKTMNLPGFFGSGLFDVALDQSPVIAGWLGSVNIGRI